jgi:hypothetical protein
MANSARETGMLGMRLSIGIKNYLPSSFLRAKKMEVSLASRAAAAVG